MADTMTLDEAIDLLNRHLAGTMFDHHPQRAIRAVLDALNHPQGVTVPHAALESDRKVVMDLRKRLAELEAQAAAGQAAPVAWMCEDLILTIADPVITRDRAHAEQRAAVMFRGKPAWRVTPLYAAPPAPSSWRPMDSAPRNTQFQIAYRAARKVIVSGAMSWPLNERIEVWRTPHCYIEVGSPDIIGWQPMAAPPPVAEKAGEGAEG